MDRRLEEFSEVNARSEGSPDAPTHALRVEEDSSRSASPRMGIARRSNRTRKQAQVYDAATGNHVDPVP